MIVLCIFFFCLFFFSSKIFNFTDVCFITYWPTDNSDILRLYNGGSGGIVTGQYLINIYL